MSEPAITWETRYRARCRICLSWVPPLRYSCDEAMTDAAQHNLSAHTRAELLEQAKAVGIRGRTKMSHEELAVAVATQVL